MNGAGLPCGSILQVEPADSSYGQSSAKYAPQLQTQPKSSSTNNQQVKGEIEHPTGEADNKKDDDSDLDDFFESLA